ncbi:MAG: glycoside hydrolase family 55 protein [Tannerella sp.]|jgi:hypothetical protein|nr:glycoside hydrolase family 55 protein [Tannerella sp.]
MKKIFNSFKTIIFTVFLLTVGSANLLHGAAVTVSGTTGYAIQQAIDAAGIGGTVTIPAGTYLVDTVILINNNVTIIGQGTVVIKAVGQGTDKLYGGYNGAVYPQSPDYSWQNIFSVNANGDYRPSLSQQAPAGVTITVTFENLTLDGNGAIRAATNGGGINLAALTPKTAVGAIAVADGSTVNIKNVTANNVAPALWVENGGATVNIDGLTTTSGIAVADINSGASFTGTPTLNIKNFTYTGDGKDKTIGGGGYGISSVQETELLFGDGPIYIKAGASVANVTVDGYIVVAAADGGYAFVDLETYLKKQVYDFNLPAKIELPYYGGDVVIDPGKLKNKEDGSDATLSAYEYWATLDGDTLSNSGTVPVTPAGIKYINKYNSGSQDTFLLTLPEQQTSRADFYSIIVYVVDRATGSPTIGKTIGAKTLLVQVGEPKFVTADLFDFDPVGFDGVTLEDVRYDGNQHAVKASLKKGITEKEVGTILGYYYIFNGDYDHPIAATMDKDGLPFPSAIGSYELVVVIADNGTVYNGTSHTGAKLVEINGKLYDFLILGKFLIYNENDYVPNYGHQVAVFSNPGLTFASIGKQPLPGVFAWGISSPLSITVTPKDGYNVDNIAITDNGTPLEAAVTKNADGSLTFVIATVNKNLSIKFTGVETVEASEAVAATTAYGATGVLYATAAAPTTLKIYTITGSLAKTATVSGTTTISLPAGIYIAAFGDGAIKKVVVK